MSRFVTSMVIFLLLIAGGIASVIYINHDASDLQKQLDQLIAVADSGDSSEAKDLAEKFTQNWDKAEQSIVMLVRHHSVDEVTKYAARLPVYAAYGQKTELIAEAKQIQAILEHIRSDERPTLHNIL